MSKNKKNDIDSDFLSDRQKKLFKYSLSFEDFMRDVVKGDQAEYGLQVKDFHREWIKLIQENNHVLILAPRRHSKTMTTGSYIIWRIVTNPNISVLIVTLNLEMASRMMTFIKNNLENNEKLIEIFGEQKGGGEWSSNKIRVRTQTVIKKEPTVVVQGWDSHMAGGGYDLIVLDDITDATNTASGAVRESMKTWLYSVLFPMIKHGKLLVIGTKWSFNDIYSEISEIPGFVMNPEWTRDAIIDEKEKKVLWPEEWPYEELMNIKKQVGSVAFSMQYRNKVISPDNAIIKYDWIQRNLYSDKPPQGLRRYMGVDPAGGKKKVGKEGDYFAAVVVGLDSNNNIYVLDAIHEKTSLSDQVDLVLGLYEKWQPLAIGIEANAMQAFFNEFVLERAPNLPTKEIKTSTDKTSRASRLSVFFETDRLYVHKNQVDLIDELIQFPYGENDDMLDGLVFSIDVSNQYSMNADWGAHLACISSKPIKQNKHGGFGKLMKTTHW